MRRSIAGWSAVAISTVFSALWAFWGSIEAFHEGWYSRTWAGNVAGALAYLTPMLGLMLPGLAALWRRWWGAGLHLVFAAAMTWVFELYDRPAVMAMLALPPMVVAWLYVYGRPEPRRLAARLLVGLPLATALVSGAYPCWMAVTRQDDGDYGLRVIEGNGVRLAWAPEGPGWPDRPANWNEARSICERLSRDGARLESEPQGWWRLPTVDEAVRSSVRRGANAGGEWDAAAGKPRYRVMPNKETPLWSRYSPSIYRWTGTEVDERRAYRIVWNGYANPLPKAVRIHLRCVADARSDGAPTGDRESSLGSGDPQSPRLPRRE